MLSCDFLLYKAISLIIFNQQYCLITVDSQVIKDFKLRLYMCMWEINKMEEDFKILHLLLLSSSRA